MKATAAPVIQQEMNEWVALGGGNSGIIGAYDGSHPTGFHRAGFEVPTTDYSRRHDPGRPYNMEWCCAGDFAHSRNAGLRARHAAVLARLMANDPALSMIVEFIGMPWPDKPVMYWARWDGVTNLKQYTGKGHDTWSHISWQRSRANERAFLWKTPPAAAAAPVTTPTAGGSKMLVVSRQTGSNQLFLCDGITSRPITDSQLADIKWLAGRGAIGPLWNSGEVWGGWSLSFGAIVPDGAGQVQLGDAQVEKLAAALAARPDNPLSDADVPTLVRAFKQAAREGAGA